MKKAEDLLKEQENADTEGQEKQIIRNEPKNIRKHRKLKRGIAAVFIIAAVLIILLSITQCTGVRKAIKNVPVLGKLPEVVDKIPVIGDIDKIPTIINGEAPSSQPVETQVHFVRPAMKTEEEIEQTGLTNEDVLAIYDNLAWELSVLSWKKTYDKDGVPLEGNISSKFDRICVCGAYSNAKNPQSDPFYGINNFKKVISKPWFNNYLKLNDIYTFDFRITSVLYDQVAVNYPITKSGAYKNQFEPIAEAIGNGKFIFTQNDLDSLPWNQQHNFTDYIGVSVYRPFEITRETIENASQEELYLLYDLYKAIYSLNIKGEIPPELTGEN